MNEDLKEEVRKKRDSLVKQIEVRVKLNAKDQEEVDRLTNLLGEE